jgi:hypothetical protein
MHVSNSKIELVFDKELQIITLYTGTFPPGTSRNSVDANGALPDLALDKINPTN